jgi:cell wall-associated NlpC family hydrolase
MKDINQYIGIPFVEHGRDKVGSDCWGLFRIFYQEQFGIDLPSYTEEYESIDNGKILSGLISKGTEEKWKRVKIGEEIYGDGILFRIMGYPMHVGIIVKKGWFLHILKGIDSALEYYNNPVWNKRVVGIFRYEQ